jgi:hypothetical protein
VDAEAEVLEAELGEVLLRRLVGIEIVVVEAATLQALALADAPHEEPGRQQHESADDLDDEV